MKLSTVIFLLFFVRWGYCSNSDDSLPIYMRGMNWNKVQEHLEEDLTLPDEVSPTKYFIDLFVNVRGHAGAEKSDFNGTVTIHFEIEQPVDHIELHSKELAIEKAKVLEKMTPPAGVTRISSNLDRETITVHFNRTIEIGETFALQIEYRGLARMDGYGLYENWAPKLNKSLDARGPFVLASMNYPTGARLWFPCYDEPHRKARFSLRVSHPSGLNVYSNDEVRRTENISGGRTSSFIETPHMHIYQLALSINDFSIIPIEVDGFWKVRVVISNNSQMLSAKNPDEPDVDIPDFFKRNLNRFSELVKSVNFMRTTFDIIVLDGTTSNSFQPGLITFGRLNIFKSDSADDFRSLTHMRPGNLIYVQNVNDMWLNDVFSFVFLNETLPEHDDEISDQIMHASLHERTPWRYGRDHRTSTQQYLTSRNSLPILKGAQLIKLTQRVCPSSMQVVKKYAVEHMGDTVYLIGFMEEAAKSCPNPIAIRQYLEDLLTQPGKALLIVKRTTDGVTIRQTRFHSTYFNSELRDTRTRYTIPILYSIDGQTHTKVFFKNNDTLKIDVPPTSIFLINHEYDHLYLVFYEDLIQLQRNITETERVSLYTALRKSMIAAISIGYVKFDKIFEQLVYYVHNNVFIKDDINSFSVRTRNILQPGWGDMLYSEATDVAFPGTCERWFDNDTTNWKEMFSDDAKYLSNLRTPHYLAAHIHCLEEWKNSISYESFLKLNFMGENTAIRPDQMVVLSRRSWYYMWPDLHRFFFRNAGSSANHRFDLLGDTVLNQVHDVLGGEDEYPAIAMRENYLKELRQFVLAHPRRAAAMSTEIEMRLEREFVREHLPKLHNFENEGMWTKMDCLAAEKSRLTEALLEICYPV